MKAEDSYALCMIVAIVSFLGFVVENVWLCATKGYIDNRNMCLPFLIGYGLAVVAIYLLFGTPKKLRLFGKGLLIKSKVVKILIYFLLVMLCVSVGEILIGKLVEKTCHFYWWDYSNLPLHITRYTTIPTSAAFSTMITLFMYKFFEPLYQYFTSWNPQVLKIVASCLMLLLTVDYLYSMYQMYVKKSMMPRWKIRTTGMRLYQLVRKCINH